MENHRSDLRFMKKKKFVRSVFSIHQMMIKSLKKKKKDSKDDFETKVKGRVSSM